MNNYQIYDEIGKGRFSKVYKGRRKQTMDYYAISSIAKEQRKRVMTSVQFLRSLNHSRIIHFHNWYETKNHLWIITEYCTGGDLRDILQSGLELTESAVRVYGADVAEGLMYMHSKELIYGDLKPSNLLLDSTATVRFYDFGLSTHFSTANTAQRMGSPAYMAPELFSTDGRLSMASDMWAFGCLLYEMLTTSPPFSSNKLHTLVNDILHKPVPPIPNCSASFSELIESLLVKDPLKRATWANVVTSDFWLGSLYPPSSEFPIEPAFEEYKSRVLSRVSPPSSRELDRQAMRMVEIALRNGEVTESTNGEDAFGAGKFSPEEELDFTDRNVEAAEPIGSVATQTTVPPSGQAQSSMVVSSPNTNGRTANPTAQPAPIAANPTTLATANNPAAHVATAAAPVGTQARAKANHQQAQQRPSSRGNGPAQPQGNGSPTPKTVSGPSHGHASSLPSAGAKTSHISTPSRTTTTVTDGVAASAAAKKTYKMDYAAFTAAASVDLSFSSTPLNELLLHSSDAHIRPLVMNHRIEKTVTQQYDANQLGFPAHPLEVLKEFSSGDLESFLTTVYRTLSTSSISPEVKTHVLHYVETICCDSSIANVVINSSVMTLCVRIASQQTQPVQMRAATAALMGNLVRFATFIHEDLAKTNILPSIFRVYNGEESVRVRRKLMACIGELLFYVATQDERYRAGWGIDHAVVRACYRSALADEDDVLKHYAVKAIENLASIPDKRLALQIFASEDIVCALLTIYTLPPSPSRTDHLRSSAACAALKLAIASDSLVETVFDSDMLVLKQFTLRLEGKGAVKYPQMALSFILFALSKSLVAVGNPMAAVWAKGCQNALFTQTSLTRASGQHIIDAIMRNMPALLAGMQDSHDHSSAAIRGKAMLLVMLLGSADGASIVDICSKGHLAYFDRIAKDKDAYVQSCLAYLTLFFSVFIGGRVLELGESTSAMPAEAVKKSVDIIVQLVTTTNIRLGIEFRREAVVNLAACVTKVRVPTSGFLPYEAAFNTIVDFVAKHCMSNRSNYAAAPVLAQPYISLLNRAQNEKRFHALQTVAAILIPVLSEGGAADMADQSSALYKAVSGAVSSICFKMPVLLKDAEPIPFYAIRLLCGCCDRYTQLLSPLATESFVLDLCKCLTKFTDNALVASLRLLLLILNTGPPELAVLAASKGVPMKLMGAFSTVFSQKDRMMDDVVETCCELVPLLLPRRSSSAGGGGSSGNPSAASGNWRVSSEAQVTACAEFVKGSALVKQFLPVCASSGEAARQAAAQCVLALVQHYPDVTTVALLSADGVTALRAAISEVQSQPDAVIALVKALQSALRASKGRASSLVAARDEVLIVLLQSIAQGTTASSELVACINSVVDLLG